MAEFHEQLLALAPDGVTRLRSQLSGPARAVVESLGRHRRTLGELESLDIVAKPTLAAIVYGLWLTGQIIPAGRRSKVPLSHPPADNQAAFKEQALEAKVTEAWVLAEADEARVAKASQFAAKAVTLFPQNPRLRFFAACLYQRANRMAEAKVEFAKAIELDPYYSDARRELARLQQRGG